MTLRRSSFRLLLGIFLPFLGAALAADTASAVTVAQWRADIETLRREIPLRHPDPFHTRSQQEFHTDLDDLSSRVPLLNDGQIVVGMQRVVAALRDAHTEVDMRSVIGQTYFPVRFEWMDDGLWVTKTTAEFRSICGTRLVAINGMMIDELYAIVRSVVSHDNEGWARVRSARYLSDASLLEHLGVIAAIAPTTFEMQTARGSHMTVELPPMPIHLLRDTLFAPDAEADGTPLYRRNPEADYWFVHLPELRVLYIKYNVCRDGPEPFSSFVARIFQIADSNPINRFIVDMRNNTGGSSRVIRPLGEGLSVRDHINSPGRLFVVIGPETFSSAVLNAVDFRRYTEATLVGEPTGGNENHYGDLRSFSLPGSGIAVYFSTKYFAGLDPENGGGVAPDRLVTTSSSDYFANIDPVFDSILGIEPPDPDHPEGLRRRGVRRPITRLCPF